jgi:tetratricopeptide (TPR) repeat protein
MKRNMLPRCRVYPIGGSLPIVILVLVLLAGCQWPWSKKEETVPHGRLIRSAVDYYEMGRNLEEAGNYPSAIDKYRESIAISPRPAAYYALGSLLGQMLQFDAAKENLRKALELSPGFGAARRELERVEAMEKLMLRGEPVPESLRKKPIPPSLRGGEEVSGEPESVSTAEAGVPGSTEERPVPEAREAQPPPVSEPPESVPGGTPGADVTAQEPPPPAETLSEEEEIRVRVLLREAGILLKDGKVEKAIDVYQEALLEFPRVGRVHASLGYAYQVAGRPRAALLAYEDALRLGYTSAALSNNLGVVYESVGKSRLAEEAYRESIEMGGVPDAHYNLAVLLDKRGGTENLEEALQEYEAYVALEPEGEFAESARARADRLRRSVR